MKISCPVSLLSSLCKICEKVVFIHLYNFLVSCGFKLVFVQVTPLSCILSLSFTVFTKLSKGVSWKLDSVFLDISKAFDKVWHRGILAKLGSLGVQGNLLDWFGSYLTNRRQRVIIVGVSSDWCKIEAGVPQGSVLEPLLFLIYINDLPSSVGSSCFYLADDCFLLNVVHSSVFLC